MKRLILAMVLLLAAMPTVAQSELIYRLNFNSDATLAGTKYFEEIQLDFSIKQKEGQAFAPMNTVTGAVKVLGNTVPLNVYGSCSDNGLTSQLVITCGLSGMLVSHMTLIVNFQDGSINYGRGSVIVVFEDGLQMQGDIWLTGLTAW